MRKKTYSIGIKTELTKQIDLRAREAMGLTNGVLTWKRRAVTCQNGWLCLKVSSILRSKTLLLMKFLFSNKAESLRETN
jgi:hypothetical protein